MQFLLSHSMSFIGVYSDVIKKVIVYFSWKVDKMPGIIMESEVEEVTLGILSELGYKMIYGPDIAPDGTSSERKTYSDVVLVERLKNAIDRLNPNVPKEAKEEAIKKERTEP